MTAMFGVTIIGCWLFRMILINLNKKIAEGESSAWDPKPDVAAETAQVESTAPEDGVQLPKAGFRYLV